MAGSPSSPLAASGDSLAAGVLLYYKYAHVPDLPALVRFYDTNCRSLALLGRVRIAPDGVNVTIGGKMSSLEDHIAALRSNPLFDGTDFKFASCHDPSDDRIAGECGFTSLSIRIVKELVTFRSHPLLDSPAIGNAGKHLSAMEFHSVLNNAGSTLESTGPVQKDKLILLDARNVYETRIGKFQNLNVATLDPGIRQYSDLPAWIDEHSEQLRNKHVLMYCTGGIRCEMASAYIRSKGAGYENVFQLYGGIQRYLEQFPNGGYFKGKNFVFDHRISVGSQDAEIVGTCLICSSSFDDYSPRCRCSYCRMLVLVCYSCKDKYSSGYVCEICQKHGKGGSPLSAIQDNGLPMEFSPDSSGEMEIESAPLTNCNVTSAELPGSKLHKKLRVLCLHGFRQNASSFKGRTSSLSKKLKSIVEFVFVDGPHAVPFIYRPHSSKQNHCMSSQQATNSSSSFQQSSPPRENCRRKFAWLVASKSDSSEEPGWRVADESFDPLQYQQQTDGLEESSAYLKSVIAQMGPFDGILGFSQGAAMAALFCEEQQRSGSMLDFRFAILCSGFIAGSTKIHSGSINCPSLHIYGDGQGQDRQIACRTSRELADLFDKGCAMIIEHDMGHIIPTRSPYIDQMKHWCYEGSNSQELGILKYEGDHRYHELNPRSIGHYLGMDVHDSAVLSNDRPLQSGVVVTIEPGVSIPLSFDAPKLTTSVPVSYT